MSLRARLLIVSVVLVAGGLLVADVATYRYLSGFMINRVDEQLYGARFYAAATIAHGGAFGGPGPENPSIPTGTFTCFRDASGKSVVSTYLPYRVYPRPLLPSELPGSGSAEGIRVFTTRSIDGSTDYRVLAQSTSSPSGTLVVAIPLADVSSTLHRLLAVEGLVSGVVLLLVGGLALWLVRLGLRPLEGIGETAGAIAAGDLSRRVEPADERTEVGRLGLSLNAMLAQIEAAFEERRASEERLRRFVGDASHELRTPLTSIRGYAELFRRGADEHPEDLAKAMRRIEEEGARMGVLVDELLLLARLDQGRPLEREHVDMAKVAADAVESARTIEPERPVELEAHGDAIVVGDAVKLRQVLDNLLDNVRVHTPERSPVRVRVDRNDDEVVASVTDEGPGFTPETADRVFERFYRGDPSRSRESGGAGLGLSIVAAIVEAHGGRVLASSPDGAGATFEIRLPASATTPNPA